MAEPDCAGRCDTAGTRLPSQQLGEGTMSRERCPHVYITSIYLYINIYIHFSVYADSTLCRLPIARGFEKRKRRTEIDHFQKAANELKCPQLSPLRTPAASPHAALRTEPHAQPRGSALSGAADPWRRRSGALCPPGPKQPRDARSRLRDAALRAGTAAPSGAAGAVRRRCGPPCGVSESPDPFGVRYSPCTGKGQPLPAAHLFFGGGRGGGRSG